MSTPRIGALCYATEQGLGRLMKSFYDGGAVQDVLIFRHTAGRKTHTEWYPEGTQELVGRPFNGPKIDEFLSRVQAMLFFETPFDWQFLTYCKARGVKTILMPMYEWTPRVWPVKPDAVLCPSLLDLDYFRPEFPEGMARFLHVPVDPTTWKLRSRAVRFLHNAGNIGSREHKGTRQLLEALPYCASPFTLTIRAQDTTSMDSMLRECRWARKDYRVEIVMGEIPYNQLWDHHDVYIAPEKYNGLSLPLQEAYAAGLTVMASDRYPHNTWLPTEPLIQVERVVPDVCISRNYRTFGESIVNPKTIAEHIEYWYNRNTSTFSQKGQEWGVANSWECLLPKYQDFFKAVIES